LVASAGWMNATAISDQAIPALIEALGDPEIQVRANSANALARLEAIPDAAIPLLIECTADSNDGLRMNAATALRLAPAGAVAEVMQHLIEDPNSRVRLIAAGCLLSAESSNLSAGAVLLEALDDPSPRVRAAAMELLESLGARGAALVAELKESDEASEELGTVSSCDSLIQTPGPHAT
jgi:HEAT repeat protein